FMCGQVPGLVSEPNANISAYLSDPDSPAVKCERRQPQPSMNAFIDCGSSLLQNDVLPATKYIKWTNRRGQKLIPKYKSSRGIDGTRHIELSCEMPTAGNKWNDWIPLTLHDDEIERITVTGAVGVRCAAVLFCECRSQ